MDSHRYGRFSFRARNFITREIWIDSIFVDWGGAGKDFVGVPRMKHFGMKDWDCAGSVLNVGNGLSRVSGQASIDDEKMSGVIDKFFRD